MQAIQSWRWTQASYLLWLPWLALQQAWASWDLFLIDNEIPAIFFRHKNTVCCPFQREQLCLVLSLLPVDLRAGREDSSRENGTGWGAWRQDVVLDMTGTASASYDSDGGPCSMWEAGFAVGSNLMGLWTSEPQLLTSSSWVLNKTISWGYCEHFLGSCTERLAHTSS